MNARNSNFKASLTQALCIMLVALAPVVAEAQVATALDAIPTGSILCAVIELVYSNVSRALATLAVISLGIGAMMGKVSWGLAMIVGTGIGVVYGAGTITAHMLSAGSVANLGNGMTIGCAVLGPGT